MLISGGALPSSIEVIEEEFNISSCALTCSPFPLRELLSSESSFQAGVLGSASVFTTTAIAPALGVKWLVPIRLKLASLCAMLAGVFIILFGLSRTYWQLVITQLCQGFFLPSLYIYGGSILPTLAGPRHAAKYVAAFYLSVPAGAAAGFMVGGALVEGPGWRWNFLGGGALLALLAPLLAAFRRPPALASSPADGGVIRGGRAALWRALRRLFYQRVYTCLALVYGLFGFIVSGYSFWLPKRTTPLSQIDSNIHGYPFS